MSPYGGDALLGFHLDSGLGLRGKREDSCLLPFAKPRQQHDLAIGELERVMIHVKHAPVDLAKDRNGVAGIGKKQEGGLKFYWTLEGELWTRKYAERQPAIIPRGKNSRSSSEGICDECICKFGRASSDTVR